MRDLGRGTGARKQSFIAKTEFVVRHGTEWLAGCCWLRTGGEHSIVPVSWKDFKGQDSGLTLISKKPEGEKKKGLKAS